MQYKMLLQHREAWQNMNAILNSRAEITSFALEVAKQLDMRYIAPPLPIQLDMTSQPKSSRADKTTGRQGDESDGFAISPELGGHIHLVHQG